MGELSEALDDFSRISKVHYTKIQQILKDKYCWKCPMQSTSKVSACKDIDSWIRITGAFERGIKEFLLSKYESEDKIETISSKYLLEVIKRHSRHLKYEKAIILKLNEDIKPFAKKDDLLIVRENTQSIKIGDLILYPTICPLSIYWFSKLKITGHIPFNISKVSRIFHIEGCKYIQLENNTEIPLEYSSGKITKIIEKEDPFYSIIF